jgi:hypothetical protein
MNGDFLRDGTTDRPPYLRFVNYVLAPVTESISDWLDTHSPWAWLFTHPIALVICALIALFLLSGLLSAIAQLTQRLWIGLLRSPLSLTRWIFGKGSQLVKRPFAEPQPDRLMVVLDRLESLKREEDELLQEVRSLLAKKS